MKGDRRSAPSWTDPETLRRQRHLGPSPAWVDPEKLRRQRYPGPRPAWVDPEKLRRHPYPGPGAAKASAAKAGQDRHRTALRLTALALFAVVVLPILWKTIAIPHSTPRVLLGTWVTTTPKYRERSFEIWPTTLIFRTGPGEDDFTAHRIDKVDVAVRSPFTLYTLHYQNQGDPEALTLYFAAGPPATIRFRGRADIVWTRIAKDW